MRYFRNLTKSTKNFWVALICLALLSTQGVALHMHEVDHDLVGHSFVLQHQHDSIDEPDQHTHTSAAHLSADDSHKDHHDSIVDETEVNGDRMSSKVSSKLPAAILPFLLFIVSLFIIQFLVVLFRNEKQFSVPRLYYAHPPLRAPPR